MASAATIALIRRLVGVLRMHCGVHLGAAAGGVVGVHFFEIGMTQGFLGRDALAGFQLDHLEEEVSRCLVHVDAELLETFEGVGYFPLREGHFEVWEVSNSLPFIIRGGSHNFEDLKYLANFRITVEKGPLVGHLEEDTAYRPHVYCCAIDLLAEQNLWGAVPKGHNLMCVRL